MEIDQRALKRPDGVTQLDWSNPYTRGLLYVGGASFAPPGKTDGSSFFTRSTALASNIAQSAGSLHGYYIGDVPDTVPGPFGPMLNFDGTRKLYTQAITGSDNGLSTYDETCLVLCTLGSSSGSQHIFGFGNVWSTSLADYGRGVGIEGGSLFAWGASASNGKTATATLPALNTPVVIAVRFSATGAIFVNGFKATINKDMSHTFGYYLATGAGVAAIESVETANFTGKIGLRVWWRRGLSDAEIMEISRNPWQLFRQPTRTTYPVVSGGTQTYTYAATGGMTFGGSATEERHKVQSVSGGLQFGGSASVSFVGLQTQVVTPSGGITFGGTATKTSTRPESVSGGIQFGGSATVETHESVRTVTPSGGITFGGSASVVFPSLMTLFPYRRFIYGRKGLLDRKISRQ